MKIDWTLKVRTSSHSCQSSPLNKYLSVHLTSLLEELMVLMVLAFSDSVGAAVAPAALGTTMMKKNKVQAVLFSEL